MENSWRVPPNLLGTVQVESYGMQLEPNREGWPPKFTESLQEGRKQE